LGVDAAILFDPLAAVENTFGADVDSVTGRGSNKALRVRRVVGASLTDRVFDMSDIVEMIDAPLPEPGRRKTHREAATWISSSCTAPCGVDRVFASD
jgi:hypothetical protein